MNAFDMARTAYSPATSAIRTPQSTEYEAFARITRQLKDAADADPQNYGSLVGALHENRRLWTMLAVSVADSENELPADLRARIFYLSEFTAHHTGRILAKEGEPSVLVEINTAIMRGLREQERRT